jgi:sulfide:quinone oxidoreductase
MASQLSASKLRVIVAGGGVAALETVLALQALAADLTAITVIAPNPEFAYRPMSVREPFSYPRAHRYPLAPIVRDAGAELLVDELAWVEEAKQIAHTASGASVEYDVLMLALGARARPRYENAVTIDDRKLDEALHGLIQDVEEGYVESIAFISPGRMAWPLPLYELALMTAGRAYDMNVELASTIITPEDGPLAVFGGEASGAVAELLERAHIQTITSAYAEVPRSGEIVINPGDRLYGPGVRGIPIGEHGFFRVDAHGRVLGVEHVYAAGDATDFAIKHGGIAAQQADAAAQSIAAVAGATLTPEPFRPVIHGVLLTADEPRYLTARITGGQGFSSEISDTPTWSPPAKIAARYLAPCLDRLDHAEASARS